MRGRRLDLKIFCIPYDFRSDGSRYYTGTTWSLGSQQGFDLNRQEFDLNQRKFDLNQRKFDLNQRKFDLHRQEFDLSRQEFD